MNFRKNYFLTLAAVTLLFGAISPSHAATTKKARSSATSTTSSDSRDVQKISADPGSATVHESTLLKWGPVNPPWRGKRPEYFVRGALLDAVEVKGSPGTYNIKILPIEVVENQYRYITFDNFKNGFDIEVFLNKDQKKLLKKGNIIEYKQWYEVKEAGGQGYAKLMDYILHQDFLPYPVTAVAYLKQPNLEWEQYVNAIKAVELANEKPNDAEVKDILDAIASSVKDQDAKTLATKDLAEWCNAQPTGKKLPPPPAATMIKTEKSKKGEGS